MTKSDSLPLAGATYSWMHQQSLTHALRTLAEVGFRQVELTTASPHIQARSAGYLDRHQLIRQLRDLELAVTSVNPGFLDINLLSPHDGFRALSVEVMLSEIEIAADLGAPMVVMMPGRRHALSPAPDEACRWWLNKALEKLIRRGEELGVALAMETNPYGYLGTSEELAAIADEFNSPYLGIAYDVANTIDHGDVAAGLRAAKDHLLIAHVSDTWKTRWAHTSPGRGDIDFAGYSDALRSIDYRGPTVYELIDMEPPMPRLVDDVTTLGGYGWTTSSLGELPHFMPVRK